MTENIKITQASGMGVDISATPELKALAEEYTEKYVEHLAAKARTTELFKEKESRKLRLWEAMEHIGFDNFQLDDGETSTQFVKKETIYEKIEDKDALVQAIRDMNLEVELLDEVINKGELRRRLRDWLEEGVPLPTGLNHYPKRTVSRTVKNNSTGKTQTISE